MSIIPDNKPAPIEEPPLKNHGSCLRRGCGALFSCLVLAIIALLIIAWLFNEPSPQRLAGLPPGFPTDIPLYRFEARAMVLHLPGSQKNTLLERLGRLPKIIFYSLLSKINPSAATQITLPKGQTTAGFRTIGQAARDLFQRQPEQKINTITITWENLDDSAANIYLFFKKNLLKQDYKILSDGVAAESILTFQKDDIDGSVIIERPAGTQTGLNVTLKVDYLKK